MVTPGGGGRAATTSYLRATQGDGDLVSTCVWVGAETFGFGRSIGRVVLQRGCEATYALQRRPGRLQEVQYRAQIELWGGKGRSRQRKSSGASIQ